MECPFIRKDIGVSEFNTPIEYDNNGEKYIYDRTEQ